jgi:DnaJ-domain-containing protein 1
MFRRSTDGVAIPVSIRMIDGAILIGTINCGLTGKLESLLAGDSAFIEFISKDGQHRFMARHQLASIEPIGYDGEPHLPTFPPDISHYDVLGLTTDDSLEDAMAAFQRQLALYSPNRWSGDDIPFEFSRYAVEKTRQINLAFTSLRALMQSHNSEIKVPSLSGPLFGAGSTLSKIA